MFYRLVEVKANRLTVIVCRRLSQHRKAEIQKDMKILFKNRRHSCIVINLVYLSSNVTRFSFLQGCFCSLKEHCSSWPIIHPCYVLFWRSILALKQQMLCWNLLKLNSDPRHQIDQMMGKCCLVG